MIVLRILKMMLPIMIVTTMIKKSFEAHRVSCCQRTQLSALVDYLRCSRYTILKFKFDISFMFEFTLPPHIHILFPYVHPYWHLIPILYKTHFHKGMTMINMMMMKWTMMMMMMMKWTMMMMMMKSRMMMMMTFLKGGLFLCVLLAASAGLVIFFLTRNFYYWFLFDII